MKMLISQLNKDCKIFSLRYLLFEEKDDTYYERMFFSLLVELRNKYYNEFAEARDFTCNRKNAENMLKSLHAGRVTPISLPYIIEDYIAQCSFTTNI